MEENNPKTPATAGKKTRLLIILVCSINLFFLGVVALISLLSVFFFQAFAQWLGPPLNAIQNLNPWLVRMMMFSGFLIYACSFWGCILMIRLKKTGFWIYAIPVFLMITASLFVVFHPLNITQLLLLVVSVIYLSTQTKHMR